MPTPENASTDAASVRPTSPTDARPRLVVMGATGAVGSQVVAAALASGNFSVVTTLGRRALTITAPPPDGVAVVQHVVDLADARGYEAHLAGQDVAVCTLGLGQPSKTSKEEFRRVDLDYVLAFAEACRRQGARHFTLMTAVGANPTSTVHYLRVKGEVEERVRALHFPRTTFFRPSMLLTAQNRYGFIQGLMLGVFPHIEGLLAGSLRKYRGIRVEDLGRAMIVNALHAAPEGDGVEICEWDGIRHLLDAPTPG